LFQQSQTVNTAFQKLGLLLSPGGKVGDEHIQRWSVAPCNGPNQVHITPQI